MTDASKLEDVRPLFELRERNYIITGGAQGIGSGRAAKGQPVGATEDGRLGDQPRERIWAA